MDNGTIIRCTERAIFGGLMAKNTLDNSKKTNAMVWASSGGRMAESMRANGVVESNTASDSTEMEKVRSAKDNGSTVVVCNGLIEQIVCV